MALLLFYVILSIFFSFLCSILEAVLLSVTPTFINVKITEGKSFAKTLKKIKEDPRFQHLDLIRQGRLSVVPIDEASWQLIFSWGKNKTLFVKQCC